METKTKTLKQPKLPPFLPFGWMSEVAAILGVHRNTISRNVKKGSGPMYDRIVKTAAAHLDYDFNDVFKSDFSAITFSLHNLYLNIGFGYRF